MRHPFDICVLMENKMNVLGELLVLQDAPQRENGLPKRYFFGWALDGMRTSFMNNLWQRFVSYMQDEVLRRAVEHYKGKSWKKIGMLQESDYLRGQHANIHLNVKRKHWTWQIWLNDLWNSVQPMIQKKMCRSVIAFGQHYPPSPLENFELIRDSSNFKPKLQVKGLSQNLRKYFLFCVHNFYAKVYGWVKLTYVQICNTLCSFTSSFNMLALLTGFW